MPLPPKKICKAAADNALSVLIVASEVTKQIADVIQFPPAQAAARILLLIFETIQMCSASSFLPIDGNCPSWNYLSRSSLRNACLTPGYLVAQKIQANREGCCRLAQRCLAMLVDIRDQMSDRWDSAPPSLLKAILRFEE